MSQKMELGRPAPWLRVVVIAALTLSVGGCGQKEDTTSSPSSQSSAAPPPQSSAAPSSIALSPAQGKVAHQAAMDAQSAYWRAHGQGQHEAPAPKHKSQDGKGPNP